MYNIRNYLKALIEFGLSFFISRDLIWNFINRKSIQNFKNSSIKLSHSDKIIIREIEKVGFAKMDLEYFGTDILMELNKYIKTLRPLNSNIKSFLIYYLGGMFKSEKQVFNKSNPLLELALNQKLIALVNNYFKMEASLTYLEINKTVISKDMKAQMSQRFHKDPGIKKCIKIFIYLNDVDVNNGPFTYVKYSHKMRDKELRQKRFGAGGIYPKEKDLKKIINKKNIIPIVGKAGTVIIADTTGLHCGGNSIKKTREMATIVYYPPGDLKKSKIHINFRGLEKIFSSITHLIPRKQRI